MAGRLGEMENGIEYVAVALRVVERDDVLELDGVC